MAESLITTLIPTYRRPRLLARALMSVLEQDFPSLCVKVLDNCSGDETEKLVSEISSHDSRIKYHCNKENIGAIRNFALSLDHVDTPYFSLLSDDDIVLPGFYSTTYRLLEEYPRAMFAVTKCIIASPSLKIRNIASKNMKRGYYEPPAGFEQFVKYGPRTWTAILFRSSVLSYVRPDPELSSNFDVDFLLRLAARYPFVSHDLVGAAFFVHPGSHTESGATILDDISGRKRLYERILNDYKLPEDIALEAISILKKNYKRRMLLSSINSLSLGDRQKAGEVIDLLRGDISLPAWVSLKYLAGMGSVSVHFAKQIKAVFVLAQRFVHYRRSKDSLTRKNQSELVSYCRKIERVITHLGLDGS